MAVKIKINILCLEVKSIENIDFRNIDTDLQFLAWKKKLFPNNWKGIM